MSAESLGEEILRKMKESSHLYHRFTLVVGRPGSGKTDRAASSHKSIVCFEKEDEAMQDTHIEDKLEAPAITVRVTAQAQTLKPWPHQTLHGTA